MWRKVVWLVWLAALALPAVGQTIGGSAYMRVLMLVNDVQAVSVTLEDGRTVFTNLTPGSVSDYLLYDVNRSTSVTLGITPLSGQSYGQTWPVPPLPAGHHTLVLVGSSANNTLQLLYVDEDDLCGEALAIGTCTIFVNNIAGSPPLYFNADDMPLVGDVQYQQIVVNQVPATSYLEFTGVDLNNPDVPVFRLQRGFFEPNVISFYSLIGSYPGTMFSDYNIGITRRAAVDTMTFLRGLVADLQLNDGETLFATENIVAILDESGFDDLVSTEGLLLTVFAPTDQAILNVAVDLYQCAVTNPDAMRELILNHILIGSYTSAQLISLGRLATMAGTTHTFTPTEGGFLIDNAVRGLEAWRYPTLNGNVYLVDTVLVPPGFSEDFCDRG